jgi:F-type H+-transporting ATPase subunit epsilon
MSDTIHLTVTTPSQILVDSGDVAAVRAEDESGSFGILPGHADLLTALVPSVVRWRTSDGAAHFCAVRGGVFTVSSGRNVAVACREAVLGDSLEHLEGKVRAVRAANRSRPQGACRAGATSCSRGASAAALSPAQSGDGSADQGGRCRVRGADLDRLAQAAEKAAEREAEGRADRNRRSAHGSARSAFSAGRSLFRHCFYCFSVAGSTAPSEPGSPFRRLH